MRHGLERIPEKDQEIDLVVDDPGADLLVTSQWPTLQSDDLEVKFLFQNLACGAGCKDLVMRQKIAVESSPLDQVAFLVVMCNQGDLLVMFHGNFSLGHKRYPSFPDGILRANKNIVADIPAHERYEKRDNRAAVPESDKRHALLVGMDCISDVILAVILDGVHNPLLRPYNFI